MFANYTIYTDGLIVATYPLHWSTHGYLLNSSAQWITQQNSWLQHTTL